MNNSLNSSPRTLPCLSICVLQAAQEVCRAVLKHHTTAAPCINKLTGLHLKDDHPACHTGSRFEGESSVCALDTALCTLL